MYDTVCNVEKNIHGFIDRYKKKSHCRHKRKIKLYKHFIPSWKFNFFVLYEKNKMFKKLVFKFTNTARLKKKVIGIILVRFVRELLDRVFHKLFNTYFIKIL